MRWPQNYSLLIHKQQFGHSQKSRVAVEWVRKVCKLETEFLSPFYTSLSIIKAIPQKDSKLTIISCFFRLVNYGIKSRIHSLTWFLFYGGRKELKLFSRYKRRRWKKYFDSVLYAFSFQSTHKHTQSVKRDHLSPCACGSSS